MRCELCQQNIFKDIDQLGQPITLAQIGVAHQNCAKQELLKRRVFKNLSLEALSMQELVELKEMLLQEVNIRSGTASLAEIFP